MCQQFFFSFQWLRGNLTQVFILHFLFVFLIDFGGWPTWHVCGTLQEIYRSCFTRVFSRVFCEHFRWYFRGYFCEYFCELLIVVANAENFHLNSRGDPF